MTRCQSAVALPDILWQCAIEHIKVYSPCTFCRTRRSGYYKVRSAHPESVLWPYIHVYVPCGCTDDGRTTARATPEVITALTLTRHTW